jgi:hypothetical protein
MGSGSGFDADLLDGLELSDIIANVLPINSIIWFSGTDAQIPTGWHICDGGGGTIDHRDRFVIGAGGAYTVGTAYGVGTWNGTITPTGSVAVGAHILTTAELPVHGHSYDDYSNEFSRNRNQVTPLNAYCATTTSTVSRDINNQDEGGGGSHGHIGSSISFTAIDPRPLWYSLYMIKKVA